MKGLAGCSHPLHKAACARLVLLLCASVSRRKASDSTSYNRARFVMCESFGTPVRGLLILTWKPIEMAWRLPPGRGSVKGDHLVGQSAKGQVQ